jgi:transposase
VLKRLRKFQEKRPQLWRKNSWFLYHDNAPAYASLLICNFLANTNTTVLPQPPYSPELASADFFLFLKLKSSLKGRRFRTIEEIAEHLQTELCSIPKKACSDCSQKWQRRWERCINAGGEYFEGDKAHLVAGMSEKL